MSQDGNSQLQRDLSRSSKNMNQMSSSQVGTGTEAIPVDNSINHYELPNLTQLLYDFTNKEQDTIMRCFRTGNYQSLRDLPNSLLPNQVVKMMREKQDTNLAWKPTDPKVEKLAGGGLFRDYEWMPDSYDTFLKQKQDERKEKERKQQLISKRPFFIGMDKYTWKYHDCFLPEEKPRDYVQPFFNAEDPYEATEEELLRAKWLHENKILSGDFRPAQAEKSLERLTPQQLPDIVNYVKKVIMIDWAEVNFIIGTNPDSFIEIKFDQKSIDTEHGLKAYMNTLIKSHEVISQFNLRRVIKFWAYKHKGHVYFMLAPPWIKFNPGIAFAGIMNQILDDQNVNENELGDDGTDNASSVNQQRPGLGDMPEGLSESAQNLFKIHQMVFKKSSFIKEPQLFSKDIEV